MKNHSALAIPALVVIGIALILFTNTQHPTAPVLHPIASFLDATYMIDGVPVTLVGGHATTTAAPGSASQIITSNFGANVIADINGDGRNDGAFLVTQTGAGSGTFYYVVVALAGDGHYTGTNGVLLGDRIAPQSLEIHDGQVVANYAERPASAPMTEQPSVGVSKYLELKGTVLAEIPANEYAVGNLLLGTDSNKTFGTYLIGSSGKPLYTIAKDPTAECVEQCAINWPPYIVASTSALTNLQAGVTGAAGTFRRSDGSLQVTYKGMPLHYFKNDAAHGTTLGQGVGNMWSLVKP